MRLEDESAIVRDAVPAEYAELVIAMTELGGTTVPLLLLAALFWLASSNRQRTALVISYAVAGVPFILLLKFAFGLPRPPETALLVPLEVDGYGFPSGHAFAAVVIYGGLATAYDRLGDRRALLAAGTIVVLVSLSRVALGVHYLGDVIAGALVGVVYLAGIHRVVDGDPTRGFAVALTLAVPAVILTGGGEDALLGLGAAIGGLLAARRIEDLPLLRSRLEAIALVAVGGGFVVGTRLAESIVEAVEPALVALYAGLVVGIFGAPALVGRVSGGIIEPSGETA